MPPHPKSGGGDAEDAFALRAHAPVSVVRAAKASLKEPTRPVTPADYGRQLFASGDPSNRPSTSYSVSGSKGFYQDGGPKLALPKLETGRPDTQATGHLRKIPSGAEREPSRLSGGSPLPGLDPALAPLSSSRTPRPTPAETVAALKANMAAGVMPPEPDHGFGRGPGSRGSSAEPASHAPGPADPRSSSSLTSSMSGLALGLAGETSLYGFGGLAAEGGDGPPLDPRRNDDLPPRPGTSRGRPGSAALSDVMDPITERFNGPPPGVQDMGNGAQVLDISVFAQYSDDDENDFDGHTHSHGQPPAHAKAHGQQPDRSHAGSSSSSSKQQHLHASHHHHPASSPSAASRTASHSHAQPSAPGHSSSSTHTPSHAASTTTNQPALPSAASGGVLDSSDAFYTWRSNVEGVLAELTSSIAAKAPTAMLCGHTARLLALVDEARRREHSSRWLNSGSAAFREAGPGGAALSMREAVSEHVFRLMDSSNSELLMKACAVVLRVVKSRQPLLQTAKLLYRLSKDSGHDVLFRREGLLEPLVHTVHIMVASAGHSANPGNMHEPLVYMNGCLKNVSNDASNQRALVKLGALHVLAALCNQLAEQAKSGDEALAESCGQVAVQVSGVLRNLAVPAHNAAAFAAAGVLPALRAACGALSGQAEVVLNTGRILSKLSLHEGCQELIAKDPEYAPLLVNLLGQYADNRAILLRIAFVLGNLTTNSMDYRDQVCSVPFALVTVVGILQRYAFGGPPAGGEAGGGSSAAAERLSRAASHEDCLVKVLRLVANLAILPEAGHVLAEEDHVAAALQHLLEAHGFEAAEELVLNTVCALTNLSYYQSDPPGFTNKVLALPAARLLPRITPLLLCDNEEAVIEAARVYGNFSRSPEVRDYMQGARVIEALVLLLDHGNSEVVYSVCGTLINFTMDAGRKGVLAGLGGGARLVEVLSRTVAQGELTERDEAIIDVVCKALFNLAADDAANNQHGQGQGQQGRQGAAARDGGAVDSEGAGGGGCGFTHEEVTEVLALVEVLEGSALGEGEELGSVLGRLAAQMRRLQQRLSSQELEALPE